MTDGGVVVLSLAPAVDRTLRVDSLRPHSVHRPSWVDERAGGKGANVVRTLKAHAVPAVLVTLLGGAQGDAVRRLAREEGLDLVDVGTPAATRVCTTVSDASGVTSFYEASPPIDAQPWAALLQALMARLPAPVLVLTGSIPNGLPEGALGDLMAVVSATGTPVWADVGGTSLLELAALGALVWPNLFEARQALGDDLAHEPAHGAGGGAEVGQAAARELVSRGAAAAVVSCGADGLALATRDGRTARVPALQVEVRNPVGAGDVLLGATLAHLLRAGRGRIADADLAAAAAYGANLASRSCETAAAADLPDGALWSGVTPPSALR